ncbi:hypothetical protein NW754_011674 [Fusarium falciforme]|nr:hypothetical protein NW754_011674 [Fusarium falciforme]KAJ4198502.1 hypothetical protein NW767_008880 [Fusarium falciforme]KAJ4251584.1 hypothetical protein NW757_006421 [Fusarium falciforme]
MSDRVLAAYWATPAIARNLTTATVVLTLLGSFGVIPSYYLFYHPSYLFQMPPHLWRPITGFLIAFERFPMNLLFDAYNLYRYCVQLETGNPRFPRKVDLIWYILLVCSWILVSHRLLPVPCSVVVALLFLPVKPPSYICPDSALPLQLSRFLEMRKITPALRSTHHSQIRVGLRCRHGGMSYGWLV